MSSGKSQTHIFESGCTYWVDTDDGQRHRLDLSTPGEIWLLPPTSANVTSSLASGGWIRVLDERVVILHGEPMSLLVEASQFGPTRWTSAQVTRATRSSKTSLPTPVDWSTEYR